MKLMPLGDKVVVKQLEAIETTKSGILLAGNEKEKPQEAEIIAVGPGGVGEQAVWICEDAVVLAVGVHTGGGAAKPLQRGGGGAQQLGGLGIEHFAVLQAGAGLLKLITGEEMGGEAGGLGGLLDLVPVGVRQEILVDTDVTAHKMRPPLKK